MNFKIKQEKGITLIALVVTVMILLILAGITLRALTDDFGIIGEAEDARTETQIALEEEIIENVTAQALSKNIYGQIEEEDLREAIENQKGKQEVTLQVIDDDMYRITFEKSGREYEIDNGGEKVIEKPTGDDYFIWSTTETSATIVGLKDIARELQTVVIPSTYQGLPVVAIAKGAYFATYSQSSKTGEKNTNLRRVKISSTIESIGRGTFSHCPNLIEIKVDKANKVFKDIDGVLLSKDGTILMQYPYAKKDEVYTIPNGVKKVNTYAFSYTMTKDIKLNESLEDLGGMYDDPFYGAEFLKATKVTIPEYTSDIEIIKKYIDDNEEIQYIEVDEKNQTFKDIDGVMFSKDGKILYRYPTNKQVEEYTVPDETEIIFKSAAIGAKNILKLVMGENMIEVQDYAFCEAIQLEILQLNDKITTLGEDAFRYCLLKELNIPENLTTIGDGCFSSYYLDDETIAKIEAINPKGYSFGGAGAYAIPACLHKYE